MHEVSACYSRKLLFPIKSLNTFKQIRNKETCAATICTEKKGMIQGPTVHSPKTQPIPGRVGSIFIFSTYKNVDEEASFHGGEIRQS